MKWNKQFNFLKKMSNYSRNSLHKKRSNSIYSSNMEYLRNKSRYSSSKNRNNRDYEYYSRSRSHSLSKYNNSCSRSRSRSRESDIKKKKPTTDANEIKRKYKQHYNKYFKDNNEILLLLLLILIENWKEYKDQNSWNKINFRRAVGNAIKTYLEKNEFKDVYWKKDEHNFNMVIYALDKIIQNINKTSIIEGKHKNKIFKIKDNIKNIEIYWENIYNKLNNNKKNVIKELIIKTLYLFSNTLLFIEKKGM